MNDFERFFDRYNGKLLAFILLLTNFKNEVVEQISVETWKHLRCLWKNSRGAAGILTYKNLVTICKEIIKVHLCEIKKSIINGPMPNIHLRDPNKLFPSLNQTLSTGLIRQFEKRLRDLGRHLPEIFNYYFLQGLNAEKIAKLLGLEYNDVVEHIRYIRSLF